MRYPQMRGNRYEVQIPQLQGGVNLGEPKNRVEDNQLTDVRNMWWQGGLLRTRPGFSLRRRHDRVDENPSMWRVENAVNERELLISRMRMDSDGVYRFFGYKLTVDALTENLGTNSYGINEAVSADGTLTTLGVKFHKKGRDAYYWFLGNGSIIEQSDGGADGWCEAQPYVPIVMVNGKGNKNTSGSDATMYEGYNMLTGQFRNWFVTDGESTEFALTAQNLANETATVEIDLVDGGKLRTVTLTFPPDTGEVISYQAVPDVTAAEAGIVDNGKLQYFGIHAYLFRKRGIVEIVVRSRYQDTAGNTVEKITGLPMLQGENPIRVTATAADNGERQRICRMQKCVWYGGDRSGVGGGTRLFVTGNPEHPNLVHWSDVNKPLYFPENNYAYIGSAEQAVTGFGKQAELLVIFKEHETYAAQYVAGIDFDVDDLISGRITDISTYLAQFPITPLHAAIGCDCPGSIRLVNNNLVWLSSDAHVYMLTSTNQYSERTVRDISDMIRPALLTHTAAERKAATAAEMQGYYLLSIGRRMYVLDSDNTVFKSFAYYGSEKRARKMLPWYIWELSGDWEQICGMVYGGDTVLIAAIDGEVLKIYSLTGDMDREYEQGGSAAPTYTPIPCRFTTKLFDFGGRSDRKTIRAVYIGVGDVPGSRVKISYISEQRTWEDMYTVVCSGEAGAADAGFMRVYRLTPNVHRALQFGVRCDCVGAMAVDGLTIQYEKQGAVR